MVSSSFCIRTWEGLRRHFSGEDKPEFISSGSLMTHGISRCQLFVEQCLRAASIIFACDLPAEATPVEAMMVSLHPVWSKKLERLEMSWLRVLHRPRFRMGFSDPETVSALPVEHHIRQSIFMLLISA